MYAFVGSDAFQDHEMLQGLGAFDDHEVLGCLEVFDGLKVLKVLDGLNLRNGLDVFISKCSKITRCWTGSVC